MNNSIQSHRSIRRGNALILVAGILVLLVIMATVFLSRTSTLRELGTAERQAAFHRDRRESAANEIAQQLADSLFVRPLDFTSAEYDLGLPPDEQRRLVSDVSAPRYGVDPEFTWNRAPWEVVPWTNPPDWLTWPLQPGQLPEMVEEEIPIEWENWQWWEDRADTGGLDLFGWPGGGEAWPPPDELYLQDVVLQPRENPLGGPGVSDTRWLRDIEPQRMPVLFLNDPLDQFGNTSEENEWSHRLADAYSHWRHLSWIGRPDNAWRMCPDIADVTGVRSFIDPAADPPKGTMTSDGVRHADPNWESAWVDGRRYYGGMYDRMDVPIEQWPAMMPTAADGGGVKRRLTDPNPELYGDSATSVYLPDEPGFEITAAPQNMDLVAGDGMLLDFWDRWLAWLRPEGYKQAIVAARAGNGNLLPPNFYDLNDLDGDGRRGEYFDSNDSVNFPGETPMDEFRPDTARWNVSRILTDTDGDGFTDSFWWLSPHVGVDGTRQVIGVSVTDNSGRMNANVATRFVKSDQTGTLESTRGWTPADLALISQNFAPLGSGEYAPNAAPVWNTGFLDIEPHQPGLLESDWDMSQDAMLLVPFVTYPANGQGSGAASSEAYQLWNSNYWRSTSNRAFLEAINVDAGGGTQNPFFPDTDIYDISDRDNRLYYFQESGQAPQHPGNIFTPFNLAEELELRAYEGNNHGWVYSRLERSLGPSDAYLNGDAHVLRGTFGRQESSEFGEQLDNRQLAHDLRHRMTLFNGARNETLPQHLWWENRAPSPRADDIVVGGALTPGDDLLSADDVHVEDMHERFYDQMRQKLDLREWERAARPQPAFNTEYDPRAFSDRLAQSILLGLTSGDVTDKDPDALPIQDPNTPNSYPVRGGRDSYFGQGDEAWERTRRLAAAITANMLASRDPDQDARLLTMEGKLPGDGSFPGAPTMDNWHGEIGAIPLPFFEGAYYPPNLEAHDHADNDGSIVFPGGETVGAGGSTDADQLLGDLSFAGSDISNRVSDYIDLSDINMPKEILPDPSAPGSELLEPWEPVCVGIDSDGDGWADWAEKRPWATATGDRVVGRLRNISTDSDWECPNLLVFSHPDMDANFESIPAWTDSYAPEVHMLGMEPQPFISEVFFAEVAKAWRIPQVFSTGAGSTTAENLGGALWVTASEDSTHFVETTNPETIVANSQGGTTYDFVHPTPSHMVMAIQLVNPFGVPLPLMERVNGELEPLYSLRFLRADRNNISSKANWTIPLDPTLVVNNDENSRLFRTSTSFNAAHLPDGIITDSDQIPMLPPSTNDRPYSLMIVLNGVEKLDGEPTEAIRWLDFLDFRPDRHPSGDLFEDPEGAPLVIEPGELLWRIDPTVAVLYAEDEKLPGGDMTSPLEWYFEGMQFGGEDADAKPKWSASETEVEPVDPNRSVMVELVRTHRRKWPIESTGPTLVDYAVNVVIDRTVGDDGVDELSHVVTMQMAAHRLPDVKTVSPNSVVAGYVPEMGPIPESLKDDWKWNTALVRYPRMLQSEFGLSRVAGEFKPILQTDATDGDAGHCKLATSPHLHRKELLIEPEDARWMQWARYGRAWAVDDYQNGSTTSAPNLKDVQEIERRLWRADRSAPRYVAANSRVTMSWSPQWAAHFGLMPGTAADNWGPGLNAGPDTEFPVIDDSSGSERTRVVQFADWNPGVLLVSPGSPQVEKLALHQSPVLVDLNLGAFGQQLDDPVDFNWTKPPVRMMRRWAEQKMGMAPNRVDADPSLAGVIDQWDVWNVNDGHKDRKIHVFVDGDPVNDWDRNNDGQIDDFDMRLPANEFLLDGNLGNDTFDKTVVEPSGEWELYWHKINNAGYGSAGSEYVDTYANALRFRHGHIYSVKWDPDGFGREFPTVDGFLDDDTSTEPYTEDNPYPYPWATRNVRLPWKHVVGDNEENEYYIFQAHKPHFFSFSPRKLDANSQVVNLDAGYEPGNVNANAMPWSYPDKGFYGPAEIDGDILMPFGYQVQLKDGNFEQVGEVLDIPSIAHEIYMPMKPPSGPGPRFSWPADYYSEWPPVPNIALMNQNGEIQTTRTYSEQLGNELADGAGVFAGRLQLQGTRDGPNAIIGDPRTTHEIVSDELVTYEPYDLKTGRGVVPDWYLRADDVAHIEPDLPASQRLLDMFVCDGPGIYDLVRSYPDDPDAYESNGADGFIDDPEDWQLYADPWAGQLSVRSSSFDNAGGFEGRPTRGLVNINTAPVEVLRTLPHMYRMVHADPHSGETPLLDDFDVNDLDLARPFSPHPRTAVPEAISQYRDGLGQLPGYNEEWSFDPLGQEDSSLIAGVPDGAPYPDRGVGLPRNWWGIDGMPGTGDDLIADLDATYSINLKRRYKNEAFADVNADETIRFSRGTRGFAGIGELFQLSRPAFYDFGFVDIDEDDVEEDYREMLGSSVAADAWRMDWSGRNPFGYQDRQVHGMNGQDSGGSALWDSRSNVDDEDNRLRDAMEHPGAFLSTDTDRYYDTQVFGLSDFEYVAAWPPGEQWEDPLGAYGTSQHADTTDPRYRELHLTGDRVAADAEEQSLLFSGISNMITTRSDVFTVHLRVRTFKRNPDSRVWDATDPERIVDDARYVMVVDRSEVDHPGDRPRILMLQRVDD